MRWRGALWVLLVACCGGAAAEPRRGLQPEDLLAVADVGEPEFSPDGRWLAYSVTSADREQDLLQSDLWQVGFKSGKPRQLTFSADSSEWLPRWSPDGRWLAFLSDRSDDDSVQLWLLPVDGGEARVLSAFPGGVEDFDWSPDSTRLALIAFDPEPGAGAEAPKNPPPIVIDRYQFKEDVTGYLGKRRRHLHLLALDGSAPQQITRGDFDHYLPAWSPDGRQIAFVSKREGDPDRHFNYDLYLVEPRPDAKPRRLTSFVGADLDPYWESRPDWSADGRRIAYLQGGEDRWVYYAPWQLAIVDVASGKVSQPALLDRNLTHPRFSGDGREVFGLLERSRVTHLVAIDLASGKVRDLTRGSRFEYQYAVSARDDLVVLGSDDHTPYELQAVQGRGLRPLTAHNAWLRQRELATVEDIVFDSSDGTQIEGFLLRPLGYREGQRYPTLLQLHGGPVYQFSHEFMADWQVYAAAGFAVVAVNPRGSSGRGFDFARAIYADWGNKDVADALAAVDHAVKLGVADPQSLGVGGWSYGGILSNYVIASDDRFRSAISGAGASNVLGLYGHDQYAAIYDLELGPPWANEALYRKLSYPFLHADRIRTDTLFLCAELDANVPCLGAEQMYQALRSLDRRTQLVIYPGEHHGLSVPSYLLDRMTRSLAWHRARLQGATSPP